MLRRVAAKRLTESDLTLFEWHFRRSKSNQKALNLNANVFIDQLYPGLPQTRYATLGKLPLDLFVYGPGFEGEYNRQRKIIKGSTYKNWRLDGEFVFNPPENPTRFNVLAEGDLVIIEFFGDVVPDSAKAVFISKALEEDRPLHAAFDGVVGDKPSMISMTPVELFQLADASGVRSGHPIFGIASPDVELEISTLGDRKETTGLRSPPSNRKVSRELLRKAKNNAESVGDLGEQLVDSYLATLKTSGQIEDFEWTSSENAGSAYDFHTRSAEGEILIDVKSTELGFDSRLHISLGELRQMGFGAARYDLYRIFEMSETTAKLRIASNLGWWARDVIAALEGLPEGVLADGVTVTPSILPFDQEIQVDVTERLDEREE